MLSTPTTSSTPDALAAVAALGRALDGLAGALTSGSPSELIVTEAALAAAVTGLTTVLRTTASIASAERPRLRTELAHARMLLERCRLVGASLSGAIDGCLQAHGLLSTYDRGGAFAAPRRQPRRTGRHV